MDRENLTELTAAVYRLTLFFPKKEPLRYKIREVAIDVLANPSKKSLDILENFLDIALAQNWVSPSDILVIREKYGIVRESLREKEEKQELSNPVEVEPIQQKDPINNGNGDNSVRRGEIIAFLKDSGKAQVRHLKEVFPDISKRTLRRDCERMLEEGLIERMGEKNDTFYKIKSA